MEWFNNMMDAYIAWEEQTGPFAVVIWFLVGFGISRIIQLIQRH